MDIKTLDHQYVANTYKRFPVEIVGGHGSIVTDRDGKEYIDLGSGIAVNAYGMGDAAWQPEDYEMANGITATIAVPEAGFNPNGLWAYFVDDGKLCLVQWNCRTDGDGGRELADLKAVLDSFP